MSSGWHVILMWCCFAGCWNANRSSRHCLCQEDALPWTYWVTLLCRRLQWHSCPLWSRSFSLVEQRTLLPPVRGLHWEVPRYSKCKKVLTTCVLFLLVTVTVCIVGVSLSEPHTSGTALHTCVYMLVCLLAAIYHKSFIRARLNILQRLNLRSIVGEGILPEHSVGVKENWSE